MRLALGECYIRDARQTARAQPLYRLSPWVRVSAIPGLDFGVGLQANAFVLLLKTWR
jgi:hypothetical protein